MSSWASLFNLLIPVAFGLFFLFGGLIAHRGFATKATWTILISAGIFLGSLIASLAFTFLTLPMEATLFMSIWGWLMLLSIFSLCIGAFLMTKNWKTLSHETAELEKLALQLATEREELEAPARSIDHSDPLSSPPESDSLTE